MHAHGSYGETWSDDEEDFKADKTCDEASAEALAAAAALAWGVS